jgi:tetratricopeptide (TPR) repeat protein
MSMDHDLPAGTSGNGHEPLESLLGRFEDAWQREQRPRIDDYLPPGDVRALVELVHIDLERCLQAGEAVLVEDYLSRYPQLAEQPTDFLDLLIAEYEFRRRRHPDLSLTEYRERFPVYAAQLEERLAEQGPPGSGRGPSEELTTPAKVVGGDPEAGPAAAGTSGVRYRALHFHARGGLGEVWVARDEEFQREVALKRIQEEYADDPDSRRRFLLEAEVTGRLEHPGIVPAYGLTRDAQARPCYAMRFIRGGTLKDALQRFHEADQPGRDPGERSLALRQLLNRFIAVCNAVAYAHSRGIVHRDLKPSNVLLGEKFGETLVVDWGLAKVVGRQEAARSSDEEGTLRPRSGGGAETRTGQAVGTLPYMSPEQAAGRWDVVGPVSDIYGLGATLYHLLTGQAPFGGGRQGEVVLQVQRGEFPRPRQVKSAVPKALEAVCLKAMALKPADRYATALALAEDVEHWLADEPVTAYREPWTVRTGRWLRRRRVLVTAVTAAAVVGLVLGGAGWLWLERQAARHEEALRQGVSAALDRATDMQKQGRFGEALAVLEQALDRVGDSGPADLRQRLERRQGDLRLVGQLDAIRLKVATVVEGNFNSAAANRDYQAAFRKAKLGQPGEDVTTVARRIRGSAIREHLVAALDYWAMVAHDWRRTVWLLAVARRADPDPWRDRFRDPKVWQDRAALVRLTRQAKVETLSPQLMTTLAALLVRHGADPVPLLLRAQGRYPQDFWLNFVLAMMLKEAKKPDQAVGYYQVALALRPGTAIVYSDLGLALQDLGRLEEAIACFQKARALEPRYAGWHLGLGIALYKKSRVERAIACYKEALALDPKCVGAHLNLGVALYTQGRLDEAIACYRRTLALDPRHASAHFNLGLTLYQKGRRDGAVALYHKAIALDPRLAQAHHGLGVALADRGQLEEAIDCYRRALALDPRLVHAHYDLGNALAAQKDVAGAIACYQKALALDPEHVNAHYCLGNALYTQGRLDEAVACFRQTLALDPGLVQAHYDLGRALRDLGWEEEAIACFHQALALDPRDAISHRNLGYALATVGREEEAIACYQKAIALDPKEARLHGVLGQALIRQGRFAEGRARMRRCLELLPPQHPWRQYFSGQLRQGERLLVLDARLPAILKGEAQPASAAERIEYAHLCMLKKRYHAGSGLWTDSFAADPKLAGDPRAGNRYNAACAAALAGSGQGKDAAGLDAGERARLRQQARSWLRADLDLWQQLLATGKATERAAVRRQLQHWQRDPDLAGIRDAAWIVNLPADELRACHQLWDDVEALLTRAGSQQ